jgi:hypothetical protein
MTSTLPPDPLLDELKNPPQEQQIALEYRAMLSRALRNEIPMADAAPWPGGVLTTHAGVRWYSKAIVLMWILVSRDFRITMQQPVCTLTVDENGITIRPRWRWFRPLLFAVYWWMIRDPMPSFSVSWSEVTEIRRTRGGFASYSAIDFHLGDRRVGIASYRTRSLDTAWSAIVHFYRASHASSSGPKEHLDLLGSPSPTASPVPSNSRSEHGLQGTLD